MNRRRWTLLSGSLIIGALLTIGVQGTYASYNAETNNTATKLASGTLTLSTTSSSTTCESWTGTGANSNINSSCGTMTIAGGPFFPGQSSTVNFSIKNTGSLAAGDLSLYAPSACSPSPGICDAVEFYVEETSSLGGTPIACYYPTLAAGACSFAAFTAAQGPGTLTDFTFNNYFNSSNRLRLTGVSGVSGGLAAQGTRFFQLGLEMPAFSTAALGNAYQGQTATFDLTWHLDQQGP